MLTREMKILLYSSNLWYLGEGMLGPLYAVFTSTIGGSVLDISWAMAIYLFFAGILTIVVGSRSDKGHMAELMVIGYALNTVFTFGYLFVRSPFDLFVVEAGLGVATAFATPTWQALYSGYERHDKRGQSWGLHTGQSKIMVGIAIVIGGLIVTTLSFTALFLIMGTIQIAATVYQATLLRKRT